MAKSKTQDADVVLKYTSQIVASFLQATPTSTDQLSLVIQEVHRTVADLHNRKLQSDSPQNPAIPVEQSITPDHIICLEDGLKFKMLKKHLMAKYKLTPEEYRQKWDLPPEYPMVAPNYATKRQQLAKASGLGRTQSSV